ncbi:MAG: hypothetical protein AAGG51_25285 [Cyanobacteria bacterium P01_G01_bin.54]
MPQLEPLPGAIAALFAAAATTRTLTEADCYGLLAALLQDNIDNEERCAIDRLLHWARRGRLSIA